MGANKNILITRSQLRTIIRESIGSINEWSANDSRARQDFEECGFMEELSNKYPEREFDYDVEEDGGVRITDIETGEYYDGQAETKVEYVGTGLPSKRDPYTEEEKPYEYFDFYDCLRGIMEKIDNNKPDGMYEK